jgi:hypothetical protein
MTRTIPSTKILSGIPPRPVHSHTPGKMSGQPGVVACGRAGRNSVGAQDMNLCEAHCWPMRSPTDASLPPLRASAHGSGSMRIASRSSCQTSTDYSIFWNASAKPSSGSGSSASVLA